MPDLEELVEMESILLVSLMGKQRPEEGRGLDRGHLDGYKDM